MSESPEKIEPIHRGCARCSSRDEAVLTSGLGPPAEGKPFGESVAVCSRPECRQGITFTGAAP